MVDKKVIGERILMLRNRASLTQEDFAAQIGISRGTLSQIELGIYYPKLEVLEAIAMKYSTTIDFIILGNENASLNASLNASPLDKSAPISVPNPVSNQYVSPNESLSASPFAAEPSQDYLTGKNTRVLAITQDSKGNENIELVPIKAAASYIDNLQEPTYLENLPKLQIPTYQLRGGTFRAFEVRGNSMFPTIQQGSMVIGRYIDDWLSIKDELVYIIVTKEAVLIKRVLNRIEKRKELRLKSDNPEFEAQNIPIEDVLEIWLLKGELRYDFKNTAKDLYIAMQHMQADIEGLKEDMEQIRINKGFFPA